MEYPGGESAWDWWSGLDLFYRFPITKWCAEMCLRLGMIGEGIRGFRGANIEVCAPSTACSPKRFFLALKIREFIASGIVAYS